MNKPSFFEIGPHKIDRLYDILKKNNLKFNRVFILGDNKTFRLGGNKIALDFQRRKIQVIKATIISSNEPMVAKVVTMVKKARPDLVIGFGGGKVLDVAKLAAGKTRIKYISIPTTLSNDGIASPVSVIKNKKNIPLSHLTTAPFGIVVDINVIKKAPARYLKAGVGDLISNLSAVFDARLAKKKQMDKIDNQALAIAEAGPKKILSYVDTKIKSNRFITGLTDGLIKSGLAMCLAGSSRPASGSEHKISHALDFLYPRRKSLHGEQVGIAAIFTMVIQGNKFLGPVMRLYANIGFPKKIKFLGLKTDEFIKVVQNACKIRPERFTVLEEKGLGKSEIKAVIQIFLK